MTGYPKNCFRSSLDVVHLFQFYTSGKRQKKKANQKNCQKLLTNDVIQKF